jgi:2-methylcitrate dehydratase PrpD
MNRSQGVAIRLAEFALSLRYRDLPPGVGAAVKTHLLDTIGVAIAARGLPSSRHVTEVASRWGGTPEATVWADGTRLPSHAVALVNGTLSHSLDFDDTHLASITHPSACVVPAALAVAESQAADGPALLTSIVAGYEVTTRIGLAADGAFHKRGFHATPLCGAFGAAAAAGVLAGLDVDQMVSAFGIVASQAAGIQAFVDEGAWTKRIHAGWAAHCAVVAAQLAQAGFAGPRHALENRYGFFASHAAPDAFDVHRVVDGLRMRWETEAIALKPYPCCHFNHSCMDAALRLQEEHGFSAGDIAEIEASVPGSMLPVVCQPPDVKAAPPTPYGALFSLPFCVAFALVRGSLGVDDVNEATIHDNGILDVAARVRCRPLASSAFPGAYPGRVRVRLRNGRTMERVERVNRGHPDNPLSRAEVMAKFRNAAARAASPAQVEAMIVAVDRSDTDTAAALVSAIAGAVEPVPVR